MIAVQLGSVLIAPKSGSGDALFPLLVDGGGSSPTQMPGLFVTQASKPHKLLQVSKFFETFYAAHLGGPLYHAMVSAEGKLIGEYVHV